MTRGLGAVLVLALLVLAFEAGRRWDDAREARVKLRAKERADAIEGEVRRATDDDLVDGILRD